MKKIKKQPVFKAGEEKYTDPYQALTAIFSRCSLESYRHFVTQILLLSSSEEKYEENSFYEIISGLKVIRQILKLGHYFYKKNIESPLIIQDHDLFQKTLFSTREEDTQCWNQRPLTLTADEYKNPYIAFRSIFRESSVREIYSGFKELAEDACNNYMNKQESINTLEIYFLLMKLFEACHLIDIREVIHRNGQLKTRLI